VTVAKRVFDIIGSIANDCGASMVIMGTQGAKGSQRFLGSHAVKAITNSSVPFIVVQKEMPVNHSIRKIVVPISMETEEKKILNIVVALAKPLKAKVALFYEVKSDEFLAKGIQNNLGFAIKHLQAEGIECSATAAPMNERFEQEVVDFTTAVHGDLIAMINKNQDGYWGLFGLNVDQNLIENDAHIPVLTVDAKPQGFMGNVFSV